MMWSYIITNSVGMNSSQLWKIVDDRGAWHSAVHGVADLVTKQQHQLLYNDVLVSAV